MPAPGTRPPEHCAQLPGLAAVLLRSEAYCNYRLSVSIALYVLHLAGLHASNVGEVGEAGKLGEVGKVGKVGEVGEVGEVSSAVGEV